VGPWNEKYILDTEQILKVLPLGNVFTCDGTGWINHQDGEVIGTGY